MKTKNSEPLQIVFLGVQHAFTMFASVVLVPKLLGIDVSVAIFMAGIETLIFHLLTKGKVPVFLGSSFEFYHHYWQLVPYMVLNMHLVE